MNVHNFIARGGNMLKELTTSELQNVVGGNAKFVRVEGAVHTIYRDEDGTVKCGTPPWPKPKPISLGRPPKPQPSWWPPHWR
jgi:bacteriocin-like protein